MRYYLRGVEIDSSKAKEVLALEGVYSVPHFTVKECCEELKGTFSGRDLLEKALEMRRAILDICFVAGCPKETLKKVRELFPDLF